MKINMKVAILVIAVFVLGGGMLYFLNQHPYSAPIISQTPISATPTNPVPSSTLIHVPIDIYAGEQSLGSVSPTRYADASSGVTISFKNVPGGNRTFFSDVYVNSKNVGQINGQNIWIVGFSPDNKYFAFKTLQSSGSFETYLNVVDIANSTSTVTLIKPPLREQDYQGEKSRLGRGVYPFIESAKWDNDNSLSVIFYFVVTGSDEGGGYYRISPKQLWRYDLTTKSYTLMQILPETFL
jgi:hypothetical protein